MVGLALNSVEKRGELSAGKSALLRCPLFLTGSDVSSSCHNDFPTMTGWDWKPNISPLSPPLCISLPPTPAPTHTYTNQAESFVGQVLAITLLPPQLDSTTFTNKDKDTTSSGCESKHTVTESGLPCWSAFIAT